MTRESPDRRQRFELVAELPCPPPPPPEASSRAEATLRHIKGLVTAEQYEVIELAAGNLSGPDVAEHLGLSIGTVKSRLFRARTKLQDDWTWLPHLCPEGTDYDYLLSRVLPPPLAVKVLPAGVRTPASIARAVRRPALAGTAEVPFIEVLIEQKADDPDPMTVVLTNRLPIFICFFAVGNPLDPRGKIRVYNDYPLVVECVLQPGESGVYLTSSGWDSPLDFVWPYQAESRRVNRGSHTCAVAAISKDLLLWDLDIVGNRVAVVTRLGGRRREYPSWRR